MQQAIHNNTQQEQQQARRIGAGLLAAFLLLLPYDLFYSQAALACFAAYTLIQLRRTVLRSLLSAPVWLTALLFLPNLLWMLCSPDQKEAWNITGRQAALVLLPALLALNRELITTYRQRLLYVFAAGCCLALLYLFFAAFRVIAYYHLPAGNFFTPAFMNHNFAAGIGIHATYLSLYAALALVILTQGLYRVQRRSAVWLHIAGMVLLAAGLLQLSSRAVFIGILLVANTVLPLLLVPPARRRRCLLLTAVCTALVLVLFTSVAAFRERYISALKTDLAGQRVPSELVESRIERWKAAAAIVRKAPLLGHGSGAEYQLLQDTYYEKKMYASFLNEFNAHSQYLYYLICFGLAGLLLYLFVLYRGFAAAWQQRDAVFAAFMVLLAVVSVSENVLNLNKGVFFFSFFFPFFLLGGSSQKRQPPAA